ncbi:MAG: TIGR03915 family putative DNA repair protein [Clostridia bacterium]
MFNGKSLNTIYLFDGTLEGLLTIVFKCYIEKTIPVKIYDISLYQSNLLYETKYIETDLQKADRIYNGIHNNISTLTWHRISYAFLSFQEKKNLAIVKYILNGFVVGPKIDEMLSLDYVLDVYKISRRVLGEAHRLKGLARFQEVAPNLCYCSLHPDNNVIEDLGHFFMKRIPTQNFILHDKVREIVFIYNQKDYRVAKIHNENFTMPDLTQKEKEYQALWKKFFHTIAIKEKTNPRLQMQFMPKKYWNDLIEKKG